MSSGTTGIIVFLEKCERLEGRLLPSAWEDRGHFPFSLFPEESYIEWPGSLTPLKYEMG